MERDCIVSGSTFPFNWSTDKIAKELQHEAAGLAHNQLPIHEAENSLPNDLFFFFVSIIVT